MADRLPVRARGALAEPPTRAWRAGRPLKRWRYVGVYGPEVMLCAAEVSIAGLRQQFWAVWDRRALRERTALRARTVTLGDARVAVRDLDVEVDRDLRPAGEAIEVASPHGRSFIWTCKTPVRAQGTVRLGGREIAVDAPGLIDDSAGYHARRTAWEWSAGAGTGAGGERVMWNLVAGVHDAPGASERTVWVDGVAREVGPVAFSPALDAVAGLAFAEEARRARREELLVVASDYVQPFGTFRGALPGGPELREGYGVMERHRARW
ncbi:MAG: DUF2804 family protein [Solirubrobacteraceae bacterium]